MFEIFTQKKIKEYTSQLVFTEGRVMIQQIIEANLPPYLISFFENTHNVQSSISKLQFEDTVKKSIKFNINYIIKPKATIIKFIFGNVETRPVEQILNKLLFFQFYRYYIDLINDFITINSPLSLSIRHIHKLIDEVNKKIHEDISEDNNPDYKQTRLNLIKLLYYFFEDLTENNPINIKIPKKILSTYFQDKGYLEIKKNVDKFFKDDIFIQEAIDLMTPKYSQAEEEEKVIDEEDIKITEAIKKAREDFLSTESTSEEIEKTQVESESVITIDDEITNVTDNSETEKDTESKEDVLYSPELLQATEIQQIPTEPKEEMDIVEFLFPNQHRRKKIIKKVFKKEENNFRDFVKSVCNEKTWSDASIKIEDLYNKNKVNFLSTEAIKFVDRIQMHFMEYIEPLNNEN